MKFERDTAFEAAMAGLARVRELEQRQQELRERGMEMLRRGLKSLDELDAEEEKEKLEKERVEQERPADSMNSSEIAIDPVLAAALDDFDPSDPFWATLDSGGGSLPTEQHSH